MTSQRRYKGMYQRWADYNPEIETECYAVWFLKQWSNWIGKHEEWQGLFGLGW